jgi:mRNA interferase MazF
VDLVTPRRFNVYLTRLDPTVGREIGKTRPCVIVSPDEIHRFLDIAIIVPLTSAGKQYPTRVPSRFGGRLGEMALDQIRSIDKSRLIKHLGELSADERSKLQETLLELLS